jgi:hypothetical protein
LARLSHESGPFVFICVETRVQSQAEVFVQLTAEGRSTRAMCTSLRYTDDEQIVLMLEDTSEQVVLVTRGRYVLPLIEARLGRHTEVTLAAPDGGRIMLQLEERKRPRHPEGDEAAAAC